MPQLLKFLLVGASNTVVSFLVFALVVNSLPANALMAGLSQAVSYSCGILWSYMLNNGWVFRGGAGAGQRFPRFVAAQLGMMVASIAGIAALSELTQWRAELVWVLVMAVVTVLNFLVMKKWVFKLA